MRKMKVIRIDVLDGIREINREFKEELQGYELTLSHGKNILPHDRASGYKYYIHTFYASFQMFKSAREALSWLRGYRDGLLKVRTQLQHNKHLQDCLNKATSR